MLFDEVRKDNEEFIENETFKYFINKENINDKDYDANKIVDIAYTNRIPKGIAAYLIRNEINKYNDSSINEMIHYYK